MRWGEPRMAMVSHLCGESKVNLYSGKSSGRDAKIGFECTEQEMLLCGEGLLNVGERERERGGDCIWN